MVAFRSLLRFLPFLTGKDAHKRQLDGDNPDGTPQGTYTSIYYSLPTDLAVPLHAPLEPSTKRCYNSNHCVDFSYPAVILQPSANIAQAVCPTSNKIVITFTNHAAFVTAQNWPMANLVLVGHGYPGCGPEGNDEGSRFYAITKSAVANAKSRSITARIVYVDRNEVTVSEPEPAEGASVTTDVYTFTERVTVDGLPTTVYSTVTTVSTVFPTPESSGLESSGVEPSFSTPVSPPEVSPSVEPGCQSDSDGFYTDAFGVTYHALCSFWNGGEQIDSLGPGYTAESCLNACSMMLPQCAGVVFSVSEGGSCTLQSDLAFESRSRVGYYTYERVTGQGSTNPESGPPESEASSNILEPTPTPSEPLEVLPSEPIFQTTEVSSPLTSDIPLDVPSASEIDTITATSSTPAEETSGEGESSELPTLPSSESETGEILPPEPTAEASATDDLASFSGGTETEPTAEASAADVFPNPGGESETQTTLSPEPTAEVSATDVLESLSSETETGAILPPEATAEASATDILPSLSSDISTQASVPALPTPTSLCPNNIDTQIFIDPAGYSYNVLCNTNIPGGDLGDPIYGLANEQDCLAACDNTLGCVATVFRSDTCLSNTDLCHCWLKNAIEPAFDDINYNSYIRVSGPPGENTDVDSSRTTNPDCPVDDNKIYVGADGTQFEVRCDIDLRGSGIDSGRSVQTSFKACLDACDAMGKDSCYGVSWVPAGQDQQWCYYKVPEDPWVPVPDFPGLVVDSARVIE